MYQTAENKIKKVITVDGLKDFKAKVHVGDTFDLRVEKMRYSLSTRPIRFNVKCKVVKKFPFLVRVDDGTDTYMLTYLDLYRGSSVYETTNDLMYGD